MREIKLRDKDKVNKEWIYSNGYYFDGINYWFIIPSDYPALAYASHRLVVFETIGQYTGLQDKNGKEIYEGDVISKEGAYVVWNRRLACWCYTFKGTPVSTPLFYVDTEIEVVGNRFENPELLEGA